MKSWAGRSRARGAAEVRAAPADCAGAGDQGPRRLARLTLKRPFSDGTLAIALDPLSLLSRLAASVPAPRSHQVRYAGVLASASKIRPLIIPKPKPAEDAAAAELGKPKREGCRYRTRAELLATLGLDAPRWGVVTYGVKPLPNGKTRDLDGEHVAVSGALAGPWKGTGCARATQLSYEFATCTAGIWQTTPLGTCKYPQ